MNQQRQIVLDTETTGLETAQGHRIIEIGGVELINRRLTGNNFHQYLQPDRDIDDAAFAVHGISNESLLDKPRFADIAKQFIDYIRGAELVIHNAAFDVGFIDHELRLLANGSQPVAKLCTVFDSLSHARRLHPGQRNTLDALCKRYNIDSSQRTLHGALLDADLLARVYLAMTGGQVGLSLDSDASTNNQSDQQQDSKQRLVHKQRPALTVIHADEAECAAHADYLVMLDKSSGGQSQALWQQLE